MKQIDKEMWKEYVTKGSEIAIASNNKYVCIPLEKFRILLQNKERTSYVLGYTDARMENKKEIQEAKDIERKRIVEEFKKIRRIVLSCHHFHGLYVPAEEINQAISAITSNKK